MGQVTYSYASTAYKNSSGQCEIIQVDWNDTAHVIVTGRRTGTYVPSGIGAGVEFASQTVGTTRYSLRSSPGSSPYATVSTTSTGTPQDLVITSVGVVNATNGAANGQITAAGTGTTAQKLWLLKGWTTVKQTIASWSGLPPGDYEVELSRNEDGYKVSRGVKVINVNDLVAAVTPYNCTANGTDDGKIVIDITRGSDHYTVNCTTEGVTFPLTGTPAQGIRYPLAPGNYHIVVTDTVTTQTLSFDVTITEPDPVPTSKNDYFHIPFMNSLSFIKQETVDNCNVYQNMDNTLFCKQKFPGFTMQNYYQKVQQCDTFPIQYYSNYSAHKVTLKKYSTGAIVKADYSSEKKESNTNQQRIFDVFITNNTDDGTKSRVYFQAGAQIPIPLRVDDALTISNNADGFNGSYTVIAIGFDELQGQQYFLINKAYAVGAPSSNAKATFIIDEEDFDVYEVQVPWAAIPEGVYYMEIATVSGVNDVLWTSEPIEVKQFHELCNLIEYRNFDNAFDMSYSTGLTCMRRVESRFFNRLPKGEDDTYRNTDQSLVKLSAKRRRAFLFETFQLPPYLHEVLNVVFGHDYFAINKVRYQTSEQYEDPKYILRYPLSNSQIVVEQYGWFDKYNGDDIGPVDPVETGFIIANGGFIKREP